MQHISASASRAGSRRHGIIALIAGFAVVIIGYIFILSKASGFFASADAAKMTLTGNAQLVSDGSSGQAVHFGSTQGTFSPIVYGRFLYERDARNSYQVQATRWNWHGLQGNHTADLKGIKAINRSAIATVYATPVATRPSDPDGYTTTVTPAMVKQNTDWYLKDRSGNIIGRSSNGDYALDIGNVEYQKASLDFLLTKVNRDGWDGVLLDEINPVPEYSYPGTRPAKYPDNTSWKNAMTAYVKYVCGGLRQNNKLCYINLGAGDDWAKNVALMTDGSKAEFFVAMDPAFGMQEAATIENGLWLQQIDWAEWAEGNLRQPLFHAATSRANFADYALGSYLLASRGKGVFSSSLNYGNDGNVYTPAMDTAKKLGSPTGSRVEDKGGIWHRSFQNGEVLVNPHTTARTYAGKTLAPTTAQVMLK